MDATRGRTDVSQFARARLAEFLRRELSNRIWTVHFGLFDRRRMDPRCDRFCVERRHGRGDGGSGPRRSFGRRDAHQACSRRRGDRGDHRECTLDSPVACLFADRLGGNTARFCQLGSRPGHRGVEPRAGRPRRLWRKARSQRPLFGDRQRVRCRADGHVRLLHWGPRDFSIDRGARYSRVGRDRDDP